MKKICPIAVRFSYEESVRIKENAVREGLSVSGYIRAHMGLDDTARRTERDEETAASLAGLNARLTRLEKNLLGAP